MEIAQAVYSSTTEERNVNWADRACGGTVLKRILAHASETPDRIAVESNGQQSSYEELIRRAANLAGHILRHGIHADERIGLLTERTTEAIVAILAIHLAGAAYVPLDPAYPTDRLEFMLADAGVKILLKQESLVSLLPSFQGSVIILDAIEAAGDNHTPLLQSTGPVDCNTLAYVIYTSGSTGRPKGVLVEHRSLLNLVNGVIGIYGLTSSDRVLQFTSVSFDISVEEIFSCLASGATLVLKPAKMLESFEGFVDSCCALNITVLNIPTAFWSSLTSALERQVLARLANSVRTIVIGGEAANPQILHRWKEKLGGNIRLLNAYGPTETTVTATVWDATEYLNDSNCAPLEQVPIGKAIPNVTAYVLDENLKPVAAGTSGELYLGGTGVARGYLNRPSATEKYFIPDPFSSDPGARLYRSGDLARKLPDGKLVCLGRTDAQVKIRGFRIELGEIESALLHCSSVTDAVVTVRSINGTKQLAGYVVPKTGTAQTVEDLREYLQQTLPSYMVPAFIVNLPALPLTPNGKVNREALPDPCAQDKSENSVRNPSSKSELIVAQAFSRVLGNEGVGDNENFFTLGGDSLKAMELSLEIERHFQKKCSVQMIFDHPSISDLAGCIAAAEDLAPSQHLNGVDWSEKEPFLRREISWYVMRKWSCELYGTDPGSYSVTAALRLNGKVDAAKLELALNAVVKRHETLRMVVPRASGMQTQRWLWPLFRWVMNRQALSRFLTQQMLQDLEADDRLPFVPLDQRTPVVLPELDVKLELKSVSTSSPQECDAALRNEIRELQLRPFDQERGPLLRAALFQMDRKQQVLAVVFHHLTADGGAVPVFTRDLMTAYTSLVLGRAPDWPPIQQSYSDYIYWLSNEPPDKRNYWKARSVSATNDRVSFPFRRTGVLPQNRTSDEAIESVTIDEVTRTALQSYAARQKCSLHAVLLSVLSVLCHRYARRNRVPITVALSGRDSPATKDLVASLSTSPVLTVDFSNAECFETILHRVREEMIEMIAHQQVTVGSMVFCELLRLAQGKDYQFSVDQPGVFFDYRTQSAIARADSGITVEEIHVPDPLWGDLEITALDNGRELTISFQFLKNRYDARGVRLMAKDYQALLTALARSQDLRFDALSQLIQGPYYPDLATR